jgi:hypothetical protein
MNYDPISPASLRRYLTDTETRRFAEFLTHLLAATHGVEFSAAELVERLNGDPNYQLAASTLEKRSTPHSSRSLGRYLTQFVGKQHGNHVLLTRDKRGYIRYRVMHIRDVKLYQRYLCSVLSYNGHNDK